MPSPRISPPQPNEETTKRHLAEIVAVCDATTWRILRFDGNLSAEGTEQAIAELLTPLLH
ncbi:hypothetical protein MIC448_260029 [Microbacterium sp. C448]|uniref:hypothetical protein n=1 Tax=Microbacterium sp. C448 TaxID=1177594 RepID=UPI0003DE07BC|nr:hypothetical protein [Microbacterium sp. C448]CDK00531.1 hypothetical protein MIC448_260029 [Microbacterium sp. C448]